MKGPAKGGYPDCGSGRYSQRLEYKDWMEFNLAQRSHKNTLEFLTPTLCMLLVAGITFPWTAVTLGCIYFVARIIFAIGYSTSPELRVPGVVLSTFCVTGLLITSFMSIARMKSSI